MIEQITVPDLGEASGVEVIELLVKVGDNIAENDSLLVLESDKAAMEIPAPKAGVVKSIDINLGEKVSTGSPILSLDIAGESSPERVSGSTSGAPTGQTAESAAPEAGEGKTEEPSKVSSKGATGDQAEATEPAAEVQTPEVAVPTDAVAVESADKVYAGPAVRKLAREMGVDLTAIAGTGTRGRIVKRDVQGFVKARINGPATSGLPVPSVPDIDFSRFGEIERISRSKLHKVTAVNMQRNWSSVPHVAQFNEADVTGLEAFRAELKAEAERKGVKLTLLPFLLKACAGALREYPQFNVSLHSSGEYLIQKKYYHIGVAVATEAGLVVPVIRDVDKKSIWQLAAELMDLSSRAKDRKLTMEEMQGACFTISSLGASGGTGFIPIINAPEVAILGVAKTAVKPVFLQGKFRPRTLLPLTLSYDHKAVNGVDGGQFADYLVRVLADIRRLML